MSIGTLGRPFIRSNVLQTIDLEIILFIQRKYEEEKNCIDSIHFTKNGRFNKEFSVMITLYDMRTHFVRQIYMIPRLYPRLNNKHRCIPRALHQQQPFIHFIHSQENNIGNMKNSFLRVPICSKHRIKMGLPLAELTRIYWTWCVFHCGAI